MKTATCNFCSRSFRNTQGVRIVGEPRPPVSPSQFFGFNGLRVPCALGPRETAPAKPLDLEITGLKRDFESPPLLVLELP